MADVRAGPVTSLVLRDNFSNSTFMFELSTFQMNSVNRGS